jgi:hypothetical protein
MYVSLGYVDMGYVGPGFWAQDAYVSMGFVSTGYVGTGMWHKISMDRRAYILVVLKFGGPTGPTKGVQGAKPPARCESVL